MAKKLQLSELKVKSFVPVVDAKEQKTTKGGYIVIDRTPYISVDIGGVLMWTETKVTKSFTETTSVGKRFGINR